VSDIAQTFPLDTALKTRGGVQIAQCRLGTSITTIICKIDIVVNIDDAIKNWNYEVADFVEIAVA